MKKTKAGPRDATTDPVEVEKFSALAEKWWDPDGAFAPLHRLNPVRLSFIRDVAAAHFGRDPRSLRPFDGLRLLDIGCGGGLVAEPMARLGFDVLGIDAAAKNVGIASAHAAAAGVKVSYRTASVEELASGGATFDVVLNLEVVEHVPDVTIFVGATAKLVQPGGLTIVATLNRTLKSLALAKIGAEYVLRWLPAGTHDWNRFVRPDELSTALERAGLTVERLQGIRFDPIAWEWRLSRDTDVNYMAVATRAPI